MRQPLIALLSLCQLVLLVGLLFLPLGGAYVAAAHPWQVVAAIGLLYFLYRYTAYLKRVG